MKKPRRTPANISSRCSTRNMPGRKIAMQIPARVKRNARNTNTDEWSREFLTTTNVDPHSKVQNANAKSARSRLDMKDPSGVLKVNFPHRFNKPRRQKRGPSEVIRPSDFAK